MADTADVLSDVLRVVRLSGAVFFRADIGPPWAVRAMATREFAARLLPQARQILSFHVIEEGRCWIALDGHAPLALARDDIVVLPYGNEHVLASDPALAPVSIAPILPRTIGDSVHQIVWGEGEERTRIVCGCLHCDELLFNPLCRGLPELLHVPAARESAGCLLTAMLHSLTREARAAQPGTACLLSRLSELLFIEVLRRYMAGLAPDAVGWLGALNDPMVGRALQWLHGNPAHPWTVEALARHVGASRSLLADRFRLLLGQPPMQYLTAWRLQLAAEFLRNGGAIAATAARVGYDSEAAFNRAFKRHTGTPPAAWRAKTIPAARGEPLPA